MPDTASGVLKLTGKGAGLLCDPALSFRPGPMDVVVPPGLIREYSLAEGTTVTGPFRKKKNERELTAIESACGLSPAAYQERTPFARLTAVDPCERFDLSVTGNTSMRIIDLVAPIGKGTRGLIVSPPKAGKTTLLELVAHAIGKGDPETRIIVLLIDERPEEVTQFRRAVKAEVLASSNDQSTQEHMELVNLTLAHARTELECGRNVVVLVDSLTRMGRAYNLGGGRGRGRTLSGGLDSGALEIPRRFFGLARNIENGGSVTIIATALVDTGSRMDQLIFEEFKGTGNSEIVLDRKLAEAYIFPAIDLSASGTRKEERLFTPDQTRRIFKLRRMLADQKPQDAMDVMLRLMEKHATNDELLQSIPV